MKNYYKQKIQELSKMVYNMSNNFYYKDIRDIVIEHKQDEELKGYYTTPCDYGSKVNQIVSLVKEELDSIKENYLDLEQAKKVVKSIVDNSMGLTSSAIESILLPLMTTNEEYNLAFNEDVNRLKEKLESKTKTNFNFEKLNDIHDNDQVQIGR